MRPIVLVALLIVSDASAQTPPFQVITTPISSMNAISPKVLFVKPDGASAPAVSEMKFEQRTQWVLRDESARDFLSKSGIVVDDRTIAAFKKLNPQVGTDGTIPAGSKVSIFAPAIATNAGADAASLKASVDMALIAKYSVSGQVAKAQQVRLQTLELPASTYERAGDVKTHRELVTDINKTATLVEQRADRMSAMDLALSKYYLTNANVSAASVTEVAKFKGISPDNIAQLQAAAAPVQRMQVMMSTGDSPFGYRRVVVSVTSKPGKKKAPPLRVYVLPGGVLDRPETFDVDQIKQLLVQLTFERLTTPSKSLVEQGDMRLWIGPDHEYVGMAKLVHERKPIAFTPVRAAPASGQDVVLKFTAPDDIVKP